MQDFEKNQNTIVTDGKGGIKVQMNNVRNVSAPVTRAVQKHENTHKSNFENKASASAKESVAKAEAGLIVTPAGADDRNKDEISAYTAEVKDYNKSLSDSTVTADKSLEKNVRANKVGAENEIKRREKLDCDKSTCK